MTWFTRNKKQDRDPDGRFAGGLDSVKDAWTKAGISHAVYENKGLITVGKIVVPKGERGKGTGTSAMKLLTDHADSAGHRIALTPSTDFGGTKSRLVDFYKDHGFVANSGRNKDFSVSETMIREPKK